MNVMNLISRGSFLGDIFNDNFYEPIIRNSSILRSDIYELDNNYVIDVDVPGLKKEDISIDYENEYLTISVKKEETKEENTNYIRRERYFGEYKRSFYIGKAKEADIQAKFTDGLLKITFPKTNQIEDSKKQITIE